MTTDTAPDDRRYSESATRADHGASLNLPEFRHRGPRWPAWIAVSVLLIFASLADLLLIRGLLLALIPAASDESLINTPTIVSVAFVVLSTIAMFSAGLAKAQFDDVQQDSSTAGRQISWVSLSIILAWAVLGALLTVVRYQAVMRGLVDRPEEEYLLTWLLLGVYFATGVFAFADGYLLAEPYGRRVRHAQAHLQRLETEIKRLDEEDAIVEGQIERFQEVAHSPGTDPESVGRAYSTQRTAIADLRAALTAFSRVEIARRVGTQEAAEAAGMASPQASGPRP